jgi:hypothetical protein
VNGVRVAMLVGMAVAIAVWHAIGVVLDVFVIAAIVVYAARRHPVKDCPKSGSGRNVPSLFIPWAKGPCRVCGGQGGHVRWSSRVIAPDVARRIREQGSRHTY